MFKGLVHDPLPPHMHYTVQYDDDCEMCDDTSLYRENS